MASTPDNLYVTYVDIDRDLLKIWGQRNRIGATYIERQLLQLLPEFNKTASPSPNRIHKGMFCFAKYTDDNYYRARVISNVQDDSVGLVFVDYGNRDIIKLSNIRVQEGNEGDVLAKMSEQAEEYYLAKVIAPPLGWTKEIISEIRRDICYDEFRYQITAQIGDQKILDIQFRDDNFSNYLVKKKLARPLSLHVQKQVILSYCRLVPDEVRSEESFREAPRVAFSSTLPSASSLRVKSRDVASDLNMQLNYTKANNTVNFSASPPFLSYPPPRQIKTPFLQMEPNIPKNSSYNPVNHVSDHMSIDPVSAQPVNCNMKSLVNHQLNQFYQMPDSTGSCINNNGSNIIEILAQQVKQYIARDNAKTETGEEKTPHHYVNSVLEVGSTYNATVSFIDDGPWSFSIQLMSSESELQKLLKELSSCDLVPVKPPIILGHPCIGRRVLDKNLCRGVVVSISRTAVKVYFVDYGNTEDLPVSSIYELPPKFFKTEVLSQKFSLSGLKKVAYSDDIKKFFREVVEKEKLLLRVVSLEDDNLPTCELFVNEINIKRILNEKMRELKGSVVEDLPRVGDTENVLVTWVISPQKFFVQLQKRDSDLKALKKELAEVQNKGQKITSQQLNVGLKCVCLYESDGHWYRAVITSINSENAITVFYVDYGNTETVNISLLRKVDDSGLINQLPNQAIQCCLKRFENQSYDQYLSQRFESLILENEFQMLVESIEKQVLYVNLYNNGNDIASLLFLTQMQSQTQLQPKVNEQETSRRNESNFWCSPETAKVTVPEKGITEVENKYQVEKSFERRNRHLYGEQNRYQERENWRDKNQSSQEKDNHWGSDQHRGWGNRGPKEFGNWESNKPPGNRGPFRGRERSNESGERSGGFNQGRNWGVRDEKRGNSYGDKKFADNRNRRFGDDKKSTDSEAKRFEYVKEWNSGSGGLDSPKKRLSGRSDRYEDKTSKRVPIKKEDAAPPGSKFAERVIDIGSCERGIVTYYFSPNEFFVQLLAQENDFKKMMKDIQWYYRDKYSVRDPIKAGDIVIAQFSFDKILYRAEVIKPSPVTVRYVDYGNHEPVHPKGTWHVAKQFLQLPQQVVKCRLSGLQPVGSDWPPPGSAVDKFFEFAEYKITFLGREGDMYEISMEAIQNGKDIASEIIAAGLGRPMDPKLEIPEIDYSLLGNQILRLYISHVDSSSKFYVVVNPKASESIAEAISAISKDEKNLYPCSLQPETPCLAAVDGSSWRRGNILKTDGTTVVVWLSDTGESVQLSKEKVMRVPGCLESLQPQALECCLYGISGVQDEESFKKTVERKNYLVHILSVTDDKRLSVILYDDDGQLLDCEKDCNVAQSIEPIGQLPVFTQQVPIVISQLNSPKEVYIQYCSDEDNVTKFLERVVNFYTEGGEDFPEGDIPTGTLVAAKSKIYDFWYRGRISSSSDEGFEVFYIDYGNKEVLPLENFKKLDSSFLEQTAFCKKVSLEIDFDSEKVEETNSKIWELYENKKLIGYFKNTGGEIIVEIKADEDSVTELLKVSTDRSDSAVDTGSGSADSSKTAEQLSDVTEYKVFVSHIDSPNRFWVSKETQINELQQFQDKLNKTCEVLPAKKEVNVGDIVAAVYSDIWCRAKVTKVEGSSATLQFIDYGSTSEVDLTSEVVTELTPDLIEVPVFAMQCTLRYTWSESATSRFVGIILQNEDPVKLVVLEEGDPVVVDLFQNEQSIAEMLLEESDEEDDWDSCTVYITHSISPRDFYVQRDSCTAALNELSERLLDAPSFENPLSIEENELYAAKYPEDGVWYRARVTAKRDDEIVVHFVDYGNTSAITEIKTLPSDLKNISNMAERCSLAYGENCDSWSSEACNVFAEYGDGRALQMSVVASGTKRAIVKLFHNEKDISKELGDLCENDERVDMYVSHATSPTDFYIQYVDDEEYRVIVESLNSEGECEDLKERAEGTICQARFTEDGCWYRARILRDLGDEGCEVFFIDFGNISLSNELKKLPKMIEDTPSRAVKCSLNLGSAIVTETMKEDFVNLTAAGAAVFRGRILFPGETNIVSLKLNGRILEETLNLDEDGEEEHENCKFDDKKTEDDQQREEQSGEAETSAEDISFAQETAEEVSKETEPEEKGICNGFKHCLDDAPEKTD